MCLDEALLLQKANLQILLLPLATGSQYTQVQLALKKCGPVGESRLI